jgi:hypothetical protein
MNGMNKNEHHCLRVRNDPERLRIHLYTDTDCIPAILRTLERTERPSYRMHQNELESV